MESVGVPKDYPVNLVTASLQVSAFAPVMLVFGE
jgi:hypothetical protein